MSLARKATIFIVAWFLIYVVAYLVFIAPSLLSKRDASPHNAPTLLRPKSKILTKRVLNFLRDPYIPGECPPTSGYNIKVGIVISAHDEKPLTVIQTV